MKTTDVIFIDVITQPRRAKFFYYIKKSIKTIFFFFTRNPKFMPYGGPDAVARSLKEGLRGIGNKKEPGALRVAAVLSSPAALKEAITRKKGGSIDYIIAGPNVSHNPSADNGIIRDESVDRILVPSEWTLNWWASLRPELLSRLRVWAAGVDKSLPKSSRTGKILLFIKNSCSLQAVIEEELEKQNLPYTKLEYGHFTRSEYLQAISTAPLMIYLSQTESQGIALLEAWMSDVPTLVWNPGEFTINEFHWSDDKMSAPYLTPETGLFFKNPEEFSSGLEQLLTKPISPRTYALAKFTNEEAAKNYLKLIN